MTEEEMNRVLAKSEKEAEKKDQKKQWVEKIVKSAKTYYKVCPYFDRKTSKCFIMLKDRCNRDGRFENCPVFIGFLEGKYEQISAKSKILPMDFMDVISAA
ncbi:hypothetical protein [Sulfodiicoccus acidiphilus]|uniref:hypothetical protein n=1 Tax=Sulfodiicoccus acidiphilus TaxID=1670455 RepID=UPI000F840B38|nr:hypothetical protein [Sulfodiicoccus acidiphilus]